MDNTSKFNNISSRGLRALVAPLDWGLGHATRCIPIINNLIARGWEVIIASDGPQKKLLQAEFPGLQFVDSPGYGINYGNSATATAWKIIFQSPKILIKIKSEKQWLAHFLTREKVHAVFSDNRYGFYSSHTCSVFITHQLAIPSPFGKTIESWLRSLNYRLIKKFTYCWIPDYPGDQSLAGVLDHPDHLPLIPTRYIGCSTRFHKTFGDFENDLLVILSGPEPQRTILEKKMLQQLALFDGRAVLVRGLPDEPGEIQVNSSLKVIHHLPASELNDLMNLSEWILARSGYTTIMDSLLLNKKTILIPTPGQPEQEYLAQYLMEKKWAFSVHQSAFKLLPVLEQAKQFPYQFFQPPPGSLLVDAIKELETSINA